MGFLKVELGSPGNIEQRWRIPVIKRMNITPQEMHLEYTRRKTAKSVVVGRGVSGKEIKDYFKEYLASKDIMSSVVCIRLIT